MKKKRVFILAEHLDCEPVDLYNEYTYIRAYHACRPLDIQKYLSDGIQVPSRKQALNEALVRICPSHVTDADVKKQFNANWKDAESKVFLNLNRQELLTASGHYLIYGSEFLNVLAMQLGCRNCLRNVGVPTLFWCDIPIDDIKPSDIFEIEKAVMGGYTGNITITVDEVLPCNIVDYEHPLQRIPDPYTGGTYKVDYQKLKDSGFTSPKLNL